MLWNQVRWRAMVRWLVWSTSLFYQQRRILIPSPLSHCAWAASPKLWSEESGDCSGIDNWVIPWHVFIYLYLIYVQELWIVHFFKQTSETVNHIIPKLCTDSWPVVKYLQQQLFCGVWRGFIGVFDTVGYSDTQLGYSGLFEWVSLNIERFLFSNYWLLHSYIYLFLVRLIGLKLLCSPVCLDPQLRWFSFTGSSLNAQRKRRSHLCRRLHQLGQWCRPQCTFQVSLPDLTHFDTIVTMLLF